MSKGFTLLELLIVISILAILSTVVVLVLNPAEYLAQARDSQRISDLSTLNSALSLYLASASSTASFCTSSNIYCTATGLIPGGSSTSCQTISTSTSVGAGGWIPVDFTQISGGSPLSKKPVDPTNNVTYKYAYKCSSSTNISYEMTTKMESAKFKSGGPADKESTDGGDTPTAYEIGISLSLLPNI